VVISPACFGGILPEFASIQCDSLATCHLDSPYALWYYPVRLCEGSESSFCSPGFRDVSVVVLLVRQVGVHPYPEPVCSLSVEPYEPFSDHYLCCQFWQEVFLVASSASE